MNTKSLLNLTIAITIAFCSCSKTDNKEIGLWEDNIKLSSKSVELNASIDSVTITTEGTSWWIAEICIDDKHYQDFSNIDFQAESYTIIQDCLEIEHKDKKILFIKVAANPNIIKRIITIDLQDRDYFDRVTITQNSK